MYYCPDGPEAFQPEGSFYFWAPWWGIWARYITYDYFGSQTDDYIERNPPLDINDEPLNLALSPLDSNTAVLITCASGSADPWPAAFPTKTLKPSIPFH